MPRQQGGDCQEDPGFHGAAFPCMIIFYGQMTENFVQWSICDELTAQVKCKNHFTENLGKNLPKNLFDRSATINLDPNGKDIAFTRIEYGLKALEYPKQLIEKAKLKLPELPKRL